MVISRVLRHLLVPTWVARRAFPPASRRAIERAVRASEREHRGELRFALEGPLQLSLLRLSTRERAKQVFAQLGVWDTDENSGVLLYVQLVDRKIEIIADRGIARRVDQAQWDQICRAMERAFGQARYEAGALEAIESVTRILSLHFPTGAGDANELPDKPVVL